MIPIKDSKKDQILNQIRGLQKSALSLPAGELRLLQQKINQLKEELKNFEKEEQVQQSEKRKIKPYVERK